MAWERKLQMKKTIIYPLRFSFGLKKTKYIPGENKFKEYLDENLTFPLNHIISNDLNSEDIVTVLLVKTVSEKRNIESIVNEAKKEITRVLSGHCAEIRIKEIAAPYSSRKEELGQIYKSLCENTEPESNVYVDFTYGPKYMPVLLFCALNYAEKYLNCTVNRLIYGLFDTNKDEHGTMVDFTTLYLLNSFGAMFDGSKNSFDTFVGNILK